MGTQSVRALVTAGGTREPIDEVRYVGNHSSGAFGAAIARALLEQYVETTVLTGKQARGLLRSNEPFTIRGFDCFRDLEVALADGATKKPDIIFMAAAVADYSPVPHAGKIVSDADELTITLRRNPKLLGRLREQCGVETFIVGFKLLADASRDELIAAAREQIKKHRLNLVVANDLASIRDGAHPIIVITPEGGTFDMIGSKEKVARELVAFVLERQKATWVRSETLSVTPPIADYVESHREATTLLAFAQQAHLLPDTDGNVSCRARDGFWITPRKVLKRLVKSSDLIFVRPALVEKKLFYHGSAKPSIDSAVHAFLYEKWPHIEAILHFHDGLVITDGTTTTAHPCGSLEEAREIDVALEDGAFTGRYHEGEPFSIRLVHHGYLLGLEKSGVHRLVTEWERAQQLYREHLREIGEEMHLEHVQLTPIFSSASIAGVWVYNSIEQYGSCFLLPEFRGKGLGERILGYLKSMKLRVAVHDDCGVLDYYRTRGWQVIERHGKISVLIAD